MAELYSTSMLGFSTYLVLWSFVIYSFLGVVAEMVFCLATKGVLESRSGLLYLPLRPMYGIGGVACMLFLHPFLQHPIQVFVLGMLICTVVEYAAAVVMETVFGVVYWDYSDKALNLHGRICLQYSVLWGLLAFLPVYAADRFLPGMVQAFGPPEVGTTVLTVVMVLVLLFWMVTLAAFARVHNRVTLIAMRAGGGPGATPTVRDRVVDVLVPDSVMINTFPQTNLTAELMELTGARAASIRVPGYRGLSAGREHRADRTGAATGQ
jgi:uncharacterized membrane protein